MKRKLLNFDNPKTSKGESFGYRTAILYLKPSFNWVDDVKHNLCIASNKACQELCLAKSGHGMKPLVKEARRQRSEWFIKNPLEFKENLIREINNHIKLSKKLDLKPVVRLNGTSDLEFFDVVNNFPNITFYEYTKRIDLALHKKKPNNLHYTFSFSGTNKLDAFRCLDNGINVAVVFHRDTIKPLTLFNREILNGDTHDLRFLHKKNKIIGLTFKAMMPKSATEKIPELKKYNFLVEKDTILKLEKDYKNYLNPIGLKSYGFGG